MSEYVEVHNQAQLDEALKRPGVIPVLMGNGRFIFTGSSSPSIVARGSSSPSIEAWGSSSPSIEAWESSSPSIEAWGSSSPSIVAWESSSPSIVARESSSPSIEARGSSSPSIEARGSSSPSIVAWGSSSPSIEARESSSPSIEARESSSPSIVVAAAAAAVLRAWGTTKIRPVLAKGGQLVELPKPDLSTAAKWCAYYGVKVDDGVAMLYKALGAKFESSYGITYIPGSEPQAPDWDGGKLECGGGLHFSPSPGHAREFRTDAQRYVACPVRLADIVTAPDGSYPQKVKAPGVCGPVVEVDRHGKPLQSTAGSEGGVGNG